MKLITHVLSCKHVSNSASCISWTVTFVRNSNTPKEIIIRLFVPLWLEANKLEWQHWTQLPTAPDNSVAALTPPTDSPIDWQHSIPPAFIHFTTYFHCCFLCDWIYNTLLYLFFTSFNFMFTKHYNFTFNVSSSFYLKFV
jgi:hypothetical protein